MINAVNAFREEFSNAKTKLSKVFLAEPISIPAHCFEKFGFSAV
jgi:hypothetical protein